MFEIVQNLDIKDLKKGSVISTTQHQIKVVAVNRRKEQITLEFPSLNPTRVRGKQVTLPFSRLLHYLKDHAA